MEKFKPLCCRKGRKTIVVLSYPSTQEALTHPHTVIISRTGQGLLHPYVQMWALGAERALL